MNINYWAAKLVWIFFFVECRWQDGAIQRLQDQLTELRAQGGVQRVVEAEEALARALVYCFSLFS